jgi:hypothetical protein
MENDKVDIRHADYTKTEPQRTLFSDVCTGTSALRDKAKQYLPKFPLEHPDDYKARCEAATLLNITSKTRDALCGLVFQKDITLGKDVPTEIQGTETEAGLSENIDQKGNHLNVFARDLFEDSFDGWAFLLVDAPTAKATDKGQEKSMGLRPYWVKYKAEDVINWDYRVNPISKKTELSLVVLRERKNESDGMMFARKLVTYYRVFHLKENENGVYWQLWKEKTEADGKTIKLELVTNDTLLDNHTEIPGSFVRCPGDAPPLIDLGYKNVEHAQTYSDYKWVLHLTCVPIPYTSGANITDNEKDQIGGKMWHLPEGGKVDFAEVKGTAIDKSESCLENIKKEMGQLGLAMLAGQPVKGDVTATETMLDSIQETSALQVQATQLKDCLERALGFTAIYLGKKADEGGSVELGCSWTQLALTTEELTAMSGLVDAGQYSLESMLWYLEKTSKLPPDITAAKEMERIKKELKDQSLVRPIIDAKEMPNEPKSGKIETA